MKSYLLYYSLKVWITGAIAGPLLFLIYLQFGHKLNLSKEDLLYSFGIYIAIVGYMFLFSIPTFIILYVSSNLVCDRFKYKLTGKFSRKVTILLITEITILLNSLVGIWIFPGYDGWGKIAVCYGLIIGLGIYIYKLDKVSVEIIS